MLQTLVIEASVLDRLSSASYDNEWFEKYLLPPTPGIKRVETHGLVYLLSDKADEHSRLLVVNIGPGGVFECNPSKRHLFERIMHVARATFEQRISLNPKWAPYEQRALLSIYSVPSAVMGAAGQRTYFDRRPKSTPHIYAFTTTSASREFSQVTVDWDGFDDALRWYEEAILTEVAPSHEPDSDYGIELEPFLGAQLIGNFSLEQWYTKKLSKGQRAFVDTPIDRPIRLRGVAGTGKTLSMVVKALRELYSAEDAKENARIAFITHSEALATEVVEGMLTALDTTHRWDRTKYATLWRGSLYQLARDFLDYTTKGLRPLSLDGVEGREL